MLDSEDPRGSLTSRDFDIKSINIYSLMMLVQGLKYDWKLRKHR